MLFVNVLYTENVYSGVKMEAYDDNDQEIIEEDVYCDVICDNCDTPAACKVSGTAGHSSDINPCPWCRCMMLDVNWPSGYDILGKYISPSLFYLFSPFLLLRIRSER